MSGRKQQNRYREEWVVVGDRSSGFRTVCVMVPDAPEPPQRLVIARRPRKWLIKRRYHWIHHK